MNADVKAKWVAALSSGDYKQGYEQLRTLDDKYCCLGVLAELAVKEGIIPPACKVDGDFFSGYKYDGDVAVLPKMVSIWAGYIPSIKLMNMNDHKHNKFVTIAKWIEENL